MTRKAFKSVTFIFMIVLTSSFFSCGDDEEQNPLVGTKWVSENALSRLYGMFDGKRYYHVYEFTSNTTYDNYFQEVLTRIKDYSSSSYSRNHEYEYHGSYVTFISEEGKRTDYYFISSTELCNKQNPSETNAVIYTKK